MSKYARYLFIWDSKGSRYNQEHFMPVAEYYLPFVPVNNAGNMIYPQIISAPTPEFLLEEGDIVALYVDVPEDADVYIMQLICFGKLACDDWILNGSSSWYFKIENGWSIC